MKYILVIMIALMPLQAKAQKAVLDDESVTMTVIGPDETITVVNGKCYIGTYEVSCNL